MTIPHPFQRARCASGDLGSPSLHCGVSVTPRCDLSLPPAFAWWATVVIAGIRNVGGNRLGESDGREFRDAGSGYTWTRREQPCAPDAGAACGYRAIRADRAAGRRARRDLEERRGRCRSGRRNVWLWRRLKLDGRCADRHCHVQRRDLECHFILGQHQHRRMDVQPGRRELHLHQWPNLDLQRYGDLGLWRQRQHRQQ